MPGVIENAINKRYDNHHHNYGYVVYAAAVLGKGDSEFLNKYYEQLMYYVRDYANPNPKDKYFPLARHHDWYSGHTWSGGLAEYDDNRNEQSFSESINAYYAVVLLGEAKKDIPLKNWGRMLLAMQVRGTRKYVQMRDTSVYP